MNTLNYNLNTPPKLNLTVCVYLCFLFFFQPINGTVTNILLNIALVPLMLWPIYRHVLLNVLREFWCKVLILLIAVIVLGCFWSPATPMEKFIILKKYHKLLYIPFLVAAFKISKAQRPALYAFICSMVIVCLLSISKQFSWIIIGSSPDPGMVFLNHIVTGIMIAFASYLTAWFSLKSSGTARLGWAGLTLLFCFQICYIGTGLTGTIVLILLLLLFIAQFFNFKKTIIIFLGSIIIFSGVSFHSTLFSSHFLRIKNEIQDFYQNKKDSSFGYRVQFNQYSYKVFQRHPYLGNGTAGLLTSYNKEHPIASWNPNFFHPHSQYCAILADYGLLGIVIYLSFLILFFIKGLTSATIRPVTLAITLIICVVGFSASLFLHSGGGYFYIMMLALCFSDSIKKESFLNTPVLMRKEQIA